MAYPTAAELVAESSVDALTSLAAQQRDEVYLAAITAIEEYCGQKFDYLPATTEVLDGTGSTVIYLPKRLEALTTITVSRSGIEASDVSLSPEKDRLTINPTPAGGWGYYEQAMWELDDRPPREFVYGDRTVTVTGDWGWASFPSAVRTAIRKDMEDTASADANLLSPTVTEFRRLGLRDVSQGNLRASITASSGLSPTVERLLQPYVWTGPIGVVV